MVVLAIVHLVAASAMSGVIWIVQVVSYPSFGLVGPRELPAYHDAHVTRIGRVVVPVMLAEAASAFWLLASNPGILTAGSVFLLLVAWSSTFAVQVPLHRRLRARPDPTTTRRLVTTNLVRAVAWTARVPVAAGILLETLAREIR